MTVGASYNSFRPIASTSADANRNVRLSLGLIF